MKKIEINPHPFQTFQATLDGQDCVFRLFQKGGRVYMDLSAGTEEILRSAPCRNGAAINQYPSPYFRGSLHFLDESGDEAPVWSGFGKRYALLYVSEGERPPEELTY